VDIIRYKEVLEEVGSEPNYEAALSEIKKLPNVSILMRSSDNEFSYVDTTNNMGFFAKTIIEGLKGYADAGDVNHIISLRELVDYIKKCYHNELVTVNTAVTNKHHRY